VTPGDARDQADHWRAAGLTVGLVPTMGALHAGHLSLVKRARDENDRVVVSVFVNPLQFGPQEDFERYPRDLDADLALLAASEVDGVYTPSVETMYPAGASTRVRVGAVAEPLEGVHRPGHFEGVATVVLKLLSATRPHRAYFGQKDAQQLAVVRRMTRDLDLGVDIVGCPIVREPDGLALSSRNVYLDPAQRSAARALSRSLRMADDAFRAGERDAGSLRALLRAALAREPLATVDYAEIVDPETFRPPGRLAVLAARFGATRLIDNHLLGEPF
jgi:pantoate--beta-alanine ligase